MPQAFPAAPLRSSRLANAQWCAATNAAAPAGLSDQSTPTSVARPRELRAQPGQLRRLLAARPAPARPEVHDRRAPAQLGQRDARRPRAPPWERGRGGRPPGVGVPLSTSAPPARGRRPPPRRGPQRPAHGAQLAARIGTSCAIQAGLKFDGVQRATSPRPGDPVDEGRVADLAAVGRGLDLDAPLAPDRHEPALRADQVLHAPGHLVGAQERPDGARACRPWGRPRRR